MLVREEFLELRIADQIEIILTPLRAPIGMIKSGALDFRVIMSEVDDELVGACRQGSEHFLVGVKPLGLRDARRDLENPIKDDRIVLDEEREIGGLLPIATHQERRELIRDGSLEIGLGEVGSADDGAHVRIDMGDVDTGGEGLVDLRVRFGEDVGHFCARVDILGEEREVAVGVEEAGILGLRGDSGPTIAGPIGVEGEMDAEVGVGMRFGPLSDFRKPRARNENAGGRDPVLFEGFFDGSVDGVHHGEVVGVDDEQPGIRGVAEALRESLAGSRSRLLSETRSEGENKNGKGKAGEAAKHESSGGATREL